MFCHFGSILRQMILSVFLVLPHKNAGVKLFMEFKIQDDILSAFLVSSNGKR
jgi:hypothetical protein